MYKTQKDLHILYTVLLIISLLLFAIYLLIYSSFVRVDICKGTCGGKYHGKTLTEEEFKKILEDHEKWLNSVLGLCDILNPNVYAIGENFIKRFPQKGRANLCGADLMYATLTGVKLLRADLNSVIFELIPESLPLITPIAHARNLSKIKFRISPHSLVELREAFKKAGLGQQVREITYAIERTRGEKQIWGEYGVIQQVYGIFRFIFFELTSKYGMSPERPLLIMMGLIIFFSFIYWFALNPRGQTGIIKDNGQDKCLLRCANKWSLCRIWWAIYFSLLSAFHIGWRELNIGNWLVRLQVHEYNLRSTGWARPVSGVQSLISVYLLAMSILTYFGRPFEG